jgi:hypothetical protein
MAILRAGVMGTSSATPGGYAMGAATDNVHLRCPRGAIARLAGHASSWTTEAVYRRELLPVLTIGAEVVDTIFKQKQPSERIGAINQRGQRPFRRLLQLWRARLPPRPGRRCPPASRGASLAGANTCQEVLSACRCHKSRDRAMMASSSRTSSFSACASTPVNVASEMSAPCRARPAVSDCRLKGVVLKKVERWPCPTAE